MNFFERCFFRLSCLGSEKFYICKMVVYVYKLLENRKMDLKNGKLNTVLRISDEQRVEMQK